MYNIYIYIFIYDDIDLDVCFYIFEIYMFLYFYIYIYLEHPETISPVHPLSLFVGVQHPHFTSSKKPLFLKMKNRFFCFVEAKYLPIVYRPGFFSVKIMAPESFKPQNAVVFFTCFGEGFGAFRRVQR